MSLTLCLLPGDGIGQEVVPLVPEICARLGITLATPIYPIGWQCFQETGNALPPATLEAVREAGNAFFGATSSPSGGFPGYRSPILDLRQQLDLYANLRPIHSLPVPGSRADIDILIVRENTECLYVRREHCPDPDTAIAERVITRRASTRIGALAARWAANRKGLLTICHKANILTKSDGLFRSAVRAAAEEVAPDIRIEEKLVDSLAHDLVRNPERFDVIVAPNLYGDILSDLASALVGGLGLAPSANRGDTHAVYEPVHGSAPDIAGKGIANPTAAYLSLEMFLRDIGEESAAQRLNFAIMDALQHGILTRDLGGTASTTDFHQAILERL